MMAPVAWAIFLAGLMISDAIHPVRPDEETVYAIIWLAGVAALIITSFRK